MLVSWYHQLVSINSWSGSLLLCDAGQRAGGVGTEGVHPVLHQEPPYP